MHHPAPVVWNLTKKIPLNYTDYHCSISYKTGWLRELRRKSTKLYHFGGPWVRIQAQTENVSVIFFCKDFSTFSYLKLASDIFGGVHKQCGLSKGRERGCCTTYVIIQFDVGEVCVWKSTWFLREACLNSTFVHTGLRDCCNHLIIKNEIKHEFPSKTPLKNPLKVVKIIRKRAKKVQIWT